MIKTKSNLFIKILSWLAVAGCMFVIFYFSSQVASVSQSTSDRFAFFLYFTENAKGIIRKIAHFLEFAALGTVLSNALYQTLKKEKPFFSFLCGLIYSISDEIHQLFVEGRACRAFDVFIDSLGVISGILFFSVILFVLNKIGEAKCQSVARRNSHDQ